MFNQIIDNLSETSSEEEAQYARIDKVKFAGCGVTEGKCYKIQRDYSSGSGMFENGEMYIVDDQGRSNHAVFLICKTTLLK